ncbi:DUF2142 domain-containing protein [Fructobacillus sp. M1-10]|uniref:DUF2142 domain-containing protein n=2 Tax=Fructobacillus papyriferae TaxID=2713171 RepID=A0ABS5QRE0_9LACO|nr:DUF2142 domain-containing protein [Fructobacillus papyriferae]MBS9334889.1 DUF2142 domain-containing protein [Fructobacillus papyriferae]
MNKKQSIKDSLSKSFFPLVFFLIFACSLGSLYVTNIGPKTLGDYDMHLFNTYALATGQVKGSFEADSDSHNMKKMVIHGSKSYLSREGANWAYENSVINPFQKDENLDLQVKSFNGPNTSTKELVRTQYPMINWMFPAVGLKVGMLLKLGTFQAWTLARIANLMSYVFIMALSITLLPKGKWLFSAIGSFPLSVFLASSVSADATNISVTALFVAFILNLKKSSTLNNKISHTEIAFLMLFTVIFFNLKVAYVPVLLLVFLLPNKFFSIRKKLLAGSGSVLIGLVSYFLWSKTFSTVLTSFYGLQDNVSFVKHHLISAFFACWNFALNTPLYFLSAIGTDSAGAKLSALTAMFGIFILVLSIIFNYNSFSGNDNIKLTSRISKYFPIILAVTVYFAVLLLTLFVLLVTWTKVYPGGIDKTYDVSDIKGLQMRYFLPLMFLSVLFYYVDDSCEVSKSERKNG